MPIPAGLKYLWDELPLTGKPLLAQLAALAAQCPAGQPAPPRRSQALHRSCSSRAFLSKSLIWVSNLGGVTAHGAFLKKNKSSHKYIFKRPNGILPSGLSLASRPLLWSLPASLLLLKHVYLVPASGPLHLPFSWTGAHFSPITIKSTPSFFSGFYSTSLS